jgi:glutaredoxin 3
MPDVTIYTTPSCPYCMRAKSLLKYKDISYREIDVTRDAALRERMVAKSGRRTVPQICIRGKPVGGFTEFAALEESGGTRRFTHSAVTGTYRGVGRSTRALPTDVVCVVELGG